MNTQSITHRRALCAAAATGVAGTLLAITLTNAYAMPGREDRPTVPGTTAHAHTHTHTHGHYVAHGCFNTPHTWSEALAGPLPRCYTYVP